MGNLTVDAIWPALTKSMTNTRPSSRTYKKVKEVTRNGNRIGGTRQTELPQIGVRLVLRGHWRQTDPKAQIQSASLDHKSKGNAMKIVETNATQALQSMNLKGKFLVSGLIELRPHAWRLPAAPALHIVRRIQMGSTSNCQTYLASVGRRSSSSLS